MTSKDSEYFSPGTMTTFMIKFSLFWALSLEIIFQFVCMEKLGHSASDLLLCFTEDRK